MRPTQSERAGCPASAYTGPLPAGCAQPIVLGSFNPSLWLLSPMAAGHREDKKFHLTSYGLRRLAPTLASSADLPLHERLPFGNWKVGCFSSTGREATKKAKLPRLYADISWKEEVERIVKAVVWSLVDTAQSSCSGDLKDATWAELAPSFRRVTLCSANAWSVSAVGVGRGCLQGPFAQR